MSSLDGIPPPAALGELVDDWRRRGSPSQRPTPWPRNAWSAEFPDDEDTFERLPDHLDRGTVSAACADTSRDSVGARAAFITAMCWGYGTTGYGPYRTARVLEDSEAPAKLAHARELTGTEGPIASYRFLATEGRIAGLGPAFGTKYLYFTDEERAGSLILDRIMADSFLELSGIRIDPVKWNVKDYGGYLAMMALWGEALGIEAEVLEQLVFVAASTDLGNQWAE